jgi:hypothetical protein
VLAGSPGPGGLLLLSKYEERLLLVDGLVAGREQEGKGKRGQARLIIVSRASLPLDSCGAWMLRSEMEVAGLE